MEVDESGRTNAAMAEQYCDVEGKREEKEVGKEKGKKKERKEKSGKRKTNFELEKLAGWAREPLVMRFDPVEGANLAT